MTRISLAGESLMGELKGYLRSELSLGQPRAASVSLGDVRPRDYEAVNARVTVTNTAPDPGQWSPIVFLGVGVSVSDSKQGDRNLPEWVRSQRIHSPEPSVAEHDAEPNYLRVVSSQAIHATTSDEERFGVALFPQQSVTFEFEVPIEHLPYASFRVEGTLSRRHLFHHQQELKMPAEYTRPPILSALQGFNAIELHRPLEAIVESIPGFGPDTKLADVQAFTDALSQSLADIESLQQRLNEVHRDSPGRVIRSHG